MTIRDLPTTYAEALAALKGRGHITVANNTHLHGPFWLTSAHRNAIDLTLHGHRIVTFFDDGSIELRDAGWWTVTTKQRLNVVARRHGYIIFSDRHQPRISHRTRQEDGTPVVFTYDWRGNFTIPAPIV